jgi:hypothetical protein
MALSVSQMSPVKRLLSHFLHPIRFENSNIENMPTSIEIPKKCHECRKYSISIPHGQCTFCQTLAFQERILCDLNRRAQLPENFECFAFTPTLKLVESSKQNELYASNGSTQPFQNFFGDVRMDDGCECEYSHKLKI